MWGLSVTALAGRISLLARWVGIFVVLNTVLQISAFAEDDVPGSQDSPLFSRYPGSWIVTYRRNTVDYHLLPTGPMVKSNGQIQAESEVRSKGRLWRLTYQLPANVAPREAFESIKEQLGPHDPEILFQCQSRACGDSSYWSSDVFNDPVLYGMDREQDYLLARFAAEDGDIYVAAYSVLRANRRAYLHLDIVQTGRNGSAEGPLKLQVPVEFSSDDQLVTPFLPDHWIDPVLQGQWKSVWLVSRIKGAEDPADLLERARNRGEQVKRLLRDQGVEDVEIEVWPLGPFSNATDDGVALWAYPKDEK